MSYDISELLADWDYQPGQVVARRFKGKDGAEKVQLRVDLGILQMNAEGRPDGKRPMGHGSWHEFQVARLETHREENDGDDEEFTLDAEPGDRVCITVTVNRDGTTGNASSEKCADVPR